jgi:hypothetical protein
VDDPEFKVLLKTKIFIVDDSELKAVVDPALRVEDVPKLLIVDDPEFKVLLKPK